MPRRTKLIIIHRDIRPRVCRSGKADTHRAYKRGGRWYSVCGLPLPFDYTRRRHTGQPCPICYPNQETAQ